MRTLEIVIILFNLLVLLALLLPLRLSHRWLKFLPAVIVILTLVHLVVEQYRWQMVPSYILTTALFLYMLPVLLKTTRKKLACGTLSFIAGGFAFLWWLVSAVLPVLLPVPRLPVSLGPYEIGSILYDWTDTTRAEIYSPDPDTKRELMVQIWYPAQPGVDARTIPYLDNFEVALPAFADFLKMPSFILEHLRLARTHAYGDVPILSDGAPYSVVVYSHGYTSYHTASTNQMEALASSVISLLPLTTLMPLRLPFFQTVALW